MAELVIPSINPIKFVPLSPVSLPQYLSKQYHLYRFEERIFPWQQKIHYCQKYQHSDTVSLQFNSDLGAITVDVIDENGVTFLTYAAVQASEDIRNVGFFAYEVTINWGDVTDGLFYVKVSGAGITFISEPIVIKDIHENTLYLEYRNSRFHENVIFETGITFRFRVEAVLGFLNPFSSDQFFNDQRFNSIVLSSKTYRNFPLHIGGSFGVPDWVIDRINMIFSCNSVKIDGTSYSKVSDAKYAFTEQENYPMRGMSFEVREVVDANVTTLTNFTALWNWSNFDITVGLHAAEIETFLVYKGSGVFTNGYPVVADFAGAPPNSFLTMKEPVDQPVKEHYVNTPLFIDGPIPDYIWHDPYVDLTGRFRIYTTRKKVTFLANNKTTFS